MRQFILPLVAVLLLGGCAGTPKFQAVTPHPIEKGSAGGRLSQVRGVDFWQSGTPNRKYAVLGYLDDYWRGDAFDEFDFKRMAPLVLKAGGNAGVEIRGDRPAPGLIRQKDEVGDYILRLQVVKYL